MTRSELERQMDAFNQAMGHLDRAYEDLHDLAKETKERSHRSLANEVQIVQTHLRAIAETWSKKESDGR